jgi:hypothetical protein
MVKDPFMYVRMHGCACAELILSVVMMFGRKLQKQSRWKLNHRDLSRVAMKVFLLLQSHFANLGSVLTSCIGYVSDMKEVVFSAKKIVQVMNSFKMYFHLYYESIRSLLKFIFHAGIVAYRFVMHSKTLHTLNSGEVLSTTWSWM